MSLNANESGKAPQEHVHATAVADRLKGDAVYLGMNAGVVLDGRATGGFFDITIADNAACHLIAVADGSIFSGDTSVYTTKGECVLTVPSGTYVAGHGLTVNNGLVASTGVAFPAAGLAGDAQTVFGVILIGGVAVTSITAALHGEQFTSTT